MLFLKKRKHFHGDKYTRRKPVAGNSKPVKLKGRDELIEVEIGKSMYYFIMNDYQTFYVLLSDVWGFERTFV